MFNHLIKKYMRFFDYDDAINLCNLAFVDAVELYDDKIKIGSFRNWAWKVIHRKIVTCIIHSNSKQAKFDLNAASLDKVVWTSGRQSSKPKSLIDFVEDSNQKSPSFDLEAESVKDSIASIIRDYVKSNLVSKRNTKEILFDYFVNGLSGGDMVRIHGKKWDNRLKNFKAYLNRIIKKHNIEIKIHSMDEDHINRIIKNREKGMTNDWNVRQRRCKVKKETALMWKIL